MVRGIGLLVNNNVKEKGIHENTDVISVFLYSVTNK